MEKIRILLYALVLMFFVIACDAGKKYYITWVDYDNTILFEEDVKEGEVPKFNGNDPKRSKDIEHNYQFNGWEPAVVACDSDATYKATYK